MYVLIKQNSNLMFDDGYFVIGMFELLKDAETAKERGEELIAANSGSARDGHNVSLFIEPVDIMTELDETGFHWSE